MGDDGNGYATDVGNGGGRAHDDDGSDGALNKITIH